MEYKELTIKSEAELRMLLQDLSAKVHDLATKARLSQLKNTRELRAAKKDVARVLTCLRAKASAKH